MVGRPHRESVHSFEYDEVGHGSGLAKLRCGLILARMVAIAGGFIALEFDNHVTLLGRAFDQLELAAAGKKPGTVFFESFAYVL